MLPDDERDSGGDDQNGAVVIPFPGGPPGPRPPVAPPRAARSNVEARLEKVALPSVPQKALRQAWQEVGYSLGLQSIGYEVDSRPAHVALREARSEVYHVYIHRDVFDVRTARERKSCERSLFYLGTLLPPEKLIIVLSEGHDSWPIRFQRVRHHWETELGLAVEFYPWSYVLALGKKRERANAIQHLSDITDRFHPVTRGSPSSGRGGRQVPSTPGNRIFICYSRKDAKWLDRLLEHLRPLERADVVDVWSDQQITHGRWKDQVISAIESARVAVLLVSTPFLASNFINDEEIPRILQQEKDNGMIILPVIISPCRFQRTPSLSQFQAVNDPEKPLTSMDENDQEAQFVRVTNIIEDALGP
jgi:hypothetical protein